MKPLTLEYIHSRCEEVGECLEWRGQCDGGPIYGGSKHRQRVRRLVFELVSGQSIQIGLHPIMKCKNKRCLNREHMVLHTQKQIMAAVGKVCKASPATKAARTKGRRSRPDVKLSMEKARDIRASDLPTKQLASDHGVRPEVINRIRRGAAWREQIPGASVFAL